MVVIEVAGDHAAGLDPHLELALLVVCGELLRGTEVRSL